MSPVQYEMGTFTQDIRFALRQLRHNPAFTIVAVLSLALGIGANTAIFQLIDAVRLRTLPVNNPQNLAYIDFAKGSLRSGWGSSRSARVTSALFNEIRTRAEGFSEIFAWSATDFDLAKGGPRRPAEAVYVSGNFFQALGVSAVLGRLFTEADDRPGCAPSAIISHNFWQREFNGAADIVGRTVSLDGRALPIAAVTRPEFFGVEVGHNYDVALPLCADLMVSNDGKGRATNRVAWWLSTMGRLKPGWTLERAQANLVALSPSIMEASLPSEYRPADAKRFVANKLAVTAGGTGVSGLRNQYGNPLWLLLAIAGLVLLIACANLANLLLARASVREKEIAVRQAIGASRGRLIAQLLSESLLLAFFGTVLGAFIAQAFSRALIAFLTTERNQLFVGLELDFRVLGFMAAVAVLTCLLFGLVPAIRATNISPASAMRASGRGITAGPERFSLRRGLVVAQVAISLVLMVGAFLFVRSLQKLMDVQPGFRPEGVIAVIVDFRPGRYSNQRLPVVTREVLDKIRTRTGALAASEVGWPPMSGSGWDEITWAEGSTTRKEAWFNRSGPDAFKTLGTEMLAGRDFDQRDDSNAPKVAIVNEAFAKLMFGGENPIGKSFRTEAEAGNPDPTYQVVGLVRNTKYFELAEQFKAISFLPIAQTDKPPDRATFLIRTNRPSAEVMRAATAAVAEVNAGLGIQFTVMSQQIKDSLTRERLMAALAAAFGFLAGALAVLGLYGVIAYMVARRRNEIGMRIALGASRGRVIWLVLREATLLLSIGVAVGLALSLWAGQAAASLLFELKPYDPSTLGGAVSVLAVVALLAAYGPAYRASRLDPMVALRED